MSKTLQFAVVSVMLVIVNSGCCLTHHRGGVCDDPVAGAVIPAQGSCGPHGCGLGLGCIGKLFHFGHYGYGCGDIYVHDWISDPPCGKDPCDCQGRWTGVHVPCDEGAHVGLPEAGVPAYLGAPPAPDPGIAACSCGRPHARGNHGKCLRASGRVLFATWMGVGNLVRTVGHGIFPHHGRFGCAAGAGCGIGCDDCGTTGGAVMDGSCPHCESEVTSSGAALGTVIGDTELPREILTRKVQEVHGRPPHPVVSSRLR